ncbi:MAG: family 43 glycosylhydrolase [Lachnospiraceae bacterium]|nr:family 43 glycosylhydrolase [Lachnospiraceae bacterium]
MNYLKVYTKKAEGDEYPNSFANSVHFALCAADGRTEELNQGCGILYARAKIRPDDTLMERGVQKPVIFKQGGEYGILAQYVDAEGNPLEPDTLLLWRTADFIDFTEQQEVARADYAALFEAGGECAELSDGLCEKIRARWLPLFSVSVEYPRGLSVKSAKELSAVKARVIYSDGSADEKRIFWNEEDIRALEPGRAGRVRGRIRAVAPEFPLAVGYADPVIFPWKGAWYFLATNDNVNDIGMFVRRADTVAGLFAPETEEHCILAQNREKGLVQTFWAPEFHVIGGSLYIIFAVSGEAWGPQCHFMRLKEGGEIICAEDWEDPVRVIKKDGRPLAQDGITLDMTWVRSGERGYLVWSYRRGIGTPADTGSMLWIAQADEARPWVLTSSPVLLSRPLYGWENTRGTINNEGPYALYANGRIYLAYSGGDACGYSYAVGYLTAQDGADLLQTASWRKLPSPMLRSTFVEGIQGPGHNSFFRDEDGSLMIAYHAQERGKYNCRCSTYHRVHFSADGLPMLNVAGERDVAGALAEVEAKVAPAEEAD